MHLQIDCHNHSRHSFDGCEQVEDICRRAVDLGLTAFAVTDHCDLYPVRYPVDQVKAAIAASVDEVDRWRRQNATATRILTGFELGEAPDYPELAEEMLALRPVDVVIGSIHRAGDIEDFYFLDCKGESLDRIHLLLDDYFDRLIRLVQWGKFDVLAHITYPLRYIVGDAEISLDLSRWQRSIDRLFEEVIQREIALEVNSSGLRQKIGVPLPDESLLRRYWQLGGRRITMGSDAHRCCDIGSGIAQCQDLLKSIGFKEICYFIQHKPQFIDL